MEGIGFLIVTISRDVNWKLKFIVKFFNISLKKIKINKVDFKTVIYTQKN